MDHSHSLHFRFPAWDLILMLSQSSNGIAQLWSTLDSRVSLGMITQSPPPNLMEGPQGPYSRELSELGPVSFTPSQFPSHPNSYSLHTRVLLVLPTSFLTILSSFAIHVIRVFERKVGKTMEWGFRQLHHHQFLTTLALNSASLPWNSLWVSEEIMAVKSNK